MNPQKVIKRMILALVCWSVVVTSLWMMSDSQSEYSFWWINLGLMMPFFLIVFGMIILGVMKVVFGSGIGKKFSEDLEERIKRIEDFEAKRILTDENLKRHQWNLKNVPRLGWAALIFFSLIPYRSSELLEEISQQGYVDQDSMNLLFDVPNYLLLMAAVVCSSIFLKGRRQNKMMEEKIRKAAA